MPSIKQKNDTVFDLAFEGRLNSMLNPVKPRTEFVSRLRGRLVKPPEITLENRSNYQAVLVISGALFAGVLVFWIYSIFRKLFGAPE